MSILLLGEQNLTFFQGSSLGKDESLSSSVINLDQLLCGNLMSFVNDWLRRGHVTQVWPLKQEGTTVCCFWKGFLVVESLVVKGTDFRAECLDYNPGAATY